MNCDCTEKISALIDGELPTSEARTLEQHLLTCRECQEAKADFLKMRSEIEEFPLPYDPVAQRDALARILGKEKVTTASRGFGWRWVFNPAVAACATLIVAGLIVAFIVYPKLKSAPVSPTEVAVNGGTKTPGPSATPALRESKPNGGGNKTTGPKKSQPPATVDKNKTPSPIKKREPIGPQPDFITQNTVEDSTERVRSADAETMTAIHLQKSEMLLRSFRNVRMNERGAIAEVGYERKRAQQLVYQNMMLRREADSAGDVQVAGLLESLEPILLDIANLPDKPAPAQVRVIKDRVERKNIVALLQVNSTALARALD